MKTLAGCALLLVACGGAPFTMADPPADDAGNASETAVEFDAGALPDALPDALKVEHDAATEQVHTVPEAAPLEASAPDAREPDATPDASPEAAPACSPFPSGIEPCPNACGGNCAQPMAAPSGFFRMTSSCVTLPTPSACTSCRERFTCACILQNWTLTVAVCGSTSVVTTCDDSTGVPVVTCH